MSRPKSEIPSYRKHSSGAARVTINNRDYLLGPYGTKASKREYDRLVAEYLAGGRSGSFGAAADQLTMSTVMVDYLRHAKRYYGTGASSEWHRIKVAVKPIKELYAKMPADEFGPEQFKAVRQSLVNSGGARTTINGHMKRIVRMFKWAATEGRLPAAIHDTLRLIPGLRRGRTEAKESKPVKPVTVHRGMRDKHRRPDRISCLRQMREICGRGTVAQSPWGDPAQMREASPHGGRANVGRQRDSDVLVAIMMQ